MRIFISAINIYSFR